MMSNFSRAILLSSVCQEIRRLNQEIIQMHNLCCSKITSGDNIKDRLDALEYYNVLPLKERICDLKIAYQELTDTFDNVNNYFSVDVLNEVNTILERY